VDLHFLRDLTHDPSPCATVYLDATHDTEDAAEVLRLRWSEHRSDLADQGADPETLGAIEAVLTTADPPAGRAGRVLVARAGEVLLDRTLPEPPEQPVARWQPLPDVLPLLLTGTEPLVAVVVRVDATGGEIYLAEPDGVPEPVDEVTGRDHPVHKVRAGGLAHLNMQQRVEETWRRNAAEVAEEIDARVRRTGAPLVVVAGDARARARLLDALGERAARIAVQVEHSGGPDGAGLDDLAAAVDEAARDLVVARRHEALERYEQAVGRGDGLAVDGIERVVAALRAEQVDTLMLDGDVERAATVWIGPEPSLLATDEDELRALGVEPAGRAPVDAALLRAAAGTGATFHPLGGGRTGLVGHPVTDGVAAVLRYPAVTGA
jgi:hypothetical protein